MQILTPRKSGVPRVPCVPKLLKAFNFEAFHDGTQIANGWNTLAGTRKRCSKIVAIGKQKLPLLTGGLAALPGAGARVFSVTDTGRGVDFV